MKLSEVLVIACFAVLCMSCSVKEDRDVCPCRLVIDMGKVDTAVVKSAELVVTASDGFCFRDTLMVDDFETGCVVDVPRGYVGVGAYFGAPGSVNDDGRLGIDYGNECPRVYMHASLVKAEGEMTVEDVLMRKNHCIMTIHVQSEKDFPFRLEAKGRIDGYESGGKPSVGEFMYAMHTDAEGMCQLALPRQTDDSLVLEVHDDTGVLRAFALGEYVAASGYDWDADDLKDITISLDYALTRIVIEVGDWREEYYFDVIM